jgi:hypothetical protein
VAEAVRHLLAPEEVQALLRLDAGEVAHLVRTGQLLKIVMCGQNRYDSKDVVALIETYRNISKRRALYEQA